MKNTLIRQQWRRQSGSTCPSGRSSTSSRASRPARRTRSTSTSPTSSDSAPPCRSSVRVTCWNRLECILIDTINSRIRLWHCNIFSIVLIRFCFNFPVAFTGHIVNWHSQIHSPRQFGTHICLFHFSLIQPLFLPTLSVMWKYKLLVMGMRGGYQKLYGKKN